MKLKFYYAIPLIVACLAGCSKDPVVATPQLSVPVGSFTGRFVRYHLTVATSKVDTVYANLLLSIDASGNYAVSGDTAKYHAGSLGTVALGANDDLVFTDKTLPPTGTPAKTHLSGTYNFTYNSGIFEMSRLGDTISTQYQFIHN
jgi:hypothetical protein